MANPPLITDFIGKTDKRAGVYGFTDDPAKYVVSRSRFLRPTLSVVGGPTFEWPLGVEGIHITGGPLIAEHKFIGDDAPSLQVMHLDDQRIALAGQFPGLTGAQNVTDILKVITHPANDGKKILSLPKILMPTTLMVVVETYDFNHDLEERTDSFDYTITLRKTATGKRTTAPKTVSSPVNPKSTKTKKGKSQRSFTVHAGARTLRAVAQLVYGNPNRWNEIYSLNTKALLALKVPTHLLPTKNLPLGMKLEY